LEDAISRLPCRPAAPGPVTWLPAIGSSSGWRGKPDVSAPDPHTCRDSSNLPGRDAFEHRSTRYRAPTPRYCAPGHVRSCRRYRGNAQQNMCNAGRRAPSRVWQCSATTMASSGILWRLRLCASVDGDRIITYQGDAALAQPDERGRRNKLNLAATPVCPSSAAFCRATSSICS
jgi:hypothetical protein